MSRVRIEYYAVFREHAGRSDEPLETNAATVADLFAEIAARYDFPVGIDRTRVAVNQEFVDWSTTLNDDDVVVFIPPVAGG